MVTGYDLSYVQALDGLPTCAGLSGTQLHRIVDGKLTGSPVALSDGNTYEILWTFENNKLLGDQLIKLWDDDADADAITVEHSLDGLFWTALTGVSRHQDGYSYAAFGSGVSPKYVKVTYAPDGHNINLTQIQLIERADRLYGSVPLLRDQPVGYTTLINGDRGMYFQNWVAISPASWWTNQPPMRVGVTGRWKNFCLSVYSRTSSPATLDMRVYIARPMGETANYQIVDWRGCSIPNINALQLVDFSTPGWDATWASGERYPHFLASDLVFICGTGGDAITISAWSNIYQEWGPAPMVYAGYLVYPHWSLIGDVREESFQIGLEFYWALGIGWVVTKEDPPPKAACGGGPTRPYRFNRILNADSAGGYTDLQARICADKSQLLPGGSTAQRNARDGSFRMRIGPPAAVIGTTTPLADVAKTLSTTAATTTFIFSEETWAVPDLGELEAKLALMVGQLESSAFRWKAIVLRPTETEFEFVGASNWFTYASVGQTKRVVGHTLRQWLPTGIAVQTGDLLAVCINQTGAGACKLYYSDTADDLADVAEWYVEQEITATTLKSAWTNNTAPTTTVALYFALHAASLLKTHCVHMDDSTDEWVCDESNANARTTACGQECSQYEPNLVEIADELAAAEEIVEGVWAQDCFAATDTPTVIDRAVRLRAKFTA